MDGDEDVLKPARLELVRASDPKAARKAMVVHMSDDFEDVRQRAFDTVYPGNDEMPLCVTAMATTNPVESAQL